MGITGNQPDPGQTAGDEVGEERVPSAPGFGGGDLRAQDFAVAVVVDAGRHEDHGVDHAATLPHFHGEASAATKVNGPASLRGRWRN